MLLLCLIVHANNPNLLQILDQEEEIALNEFSKLEQKLSGKDSRYTS
jgi:hypothetical protein